MNTLKQDHSRSGDDQGGSALVMAVFVLALLTAMGTALLFVSQNEIKSSEASIRPKKAFYFAEAGLEHARQQLWNLNGALPFADDLLRATNSASDPTDPIDYDPLTIAPIYDSGGNVTGFSGYDDDVPLVALQQLDDGWYAAFMSNDHGEGRTNPIDSDDRVIISGVGVGPDQSFEVVEAVINIDPFLPQMPPVTIFMLGPTPNFSSGSSKVKSYSGEDCGVAGGDYYPIVGTIGTAAEASAEAGINANPSWSSGGALADPTDAFSDLTGTPVDSMSDTTWALDPEWTDCQAMHDMVESMRTSADVICPGGSSYASCSGMPANAAGRLIFADGDFDVGPGGPNFGVLLVTGALVMAGNTSWEGLILVMGEGQFRMNGAGNGSMEGGMIVANIAGPDGVYGNVDDCTGGDAGFGVTIYDESGGGNAGTTYCSTVLEANELAPPYEILEFRQH